MNVVIIDDEQHAIDLLEFHLTSKFPEIIVKGKFLDAKTALSFLAESSIDIIFTDVDMPSINGVEMTRLLNHMNTPVVFVTAHSSYAIDAIKLDVFDYLLKPINSEELIRVIDKYRKTNFQKIPKSDTISFKISNRHIIARKDEITHVKSEGNYSTVYFLNRPELLITKTMKKMVEEYFGLPNFFRSHQSYLVNLNHLIEYNGHQIVLTGGIKVSLSRGKAEELKALV